MSEPFCFQGFGKYRTRDGKFVILERNTAQSDSIYWESHVLLGRFEYQARKDTWTIEGRFELPDNTGRWCSASSNDLVGGLIVEQPTSTHTEQTANHLTKDDVLALIREEHHHISEQAIHAIVAKYGLPHKKPAAESIQSQQDQSEFSRCLLELLRSKDRGKLSNTGNWVLRDLMMETLEAFERSRKQAATSDSKRLLGNG